MIRFSVLLNLLKKRVVFKRMNKAKANRFSKKLNSYSARFDRTGKIPEKHVKPYVRKQLIFSFGMLLSEVNQTKLILPLDQESFFCKLWNDPLQLLNKK